MRISVVDVSGAHLCQEQRCNSICIHTVEVSSAVKQDLQCSRSTLLDGCRECCGACMSLGSVLAKQIFQRHEHM